MKLKKIKFSLIFELLLILMLAIVPALHADEEYTPQELGLFVYSDGVVDLRYSVDVDPTLVSVNVTLFGEDYENMIAKDQEGELLDIKIFSGFVKIDVLGSQSVDIEYTASDLTNKTGSLWILNMIVPINVNVQLPSRATIISLDPTPLSISIVEDSVGLTMPQGEIEITYVLGVVGTKEHAVALINEAEKAIEEAKSEGINVDGAESLLQQAKDAYDEARYSQAEQYAEQAKNDVSETSQSASEAKNAIENADSAIKTAQNEGRTSLIEDAEEELASAQTAYDLGDYETAKTSAEQALSSALNSKRSSQSIYVFLAGLLGLTAVGVLAFTTRKQDGSGKIESEHQIDVETIFSRHPQLRFDEKEALKFISEAKEGVFVSELRERFDLPKSSSWRMIRRLESYDVIETKSVGRETFVQIHRKYRK